MVKNWFCSYVKPYPGLKNGNFDRFHKNPEKLMPKGLKLGSSKQKASTLTSEPLLMTKTYICLPLAVKRGEFRLK